MTDTRLKDCLDRWTGELLPTPVRVEVERSHSYVLASIARVCRLQYKPDVGRDHWRTPMETWDNRGGDCEDIAILTGAAIKAALPEVPIDLVLAWKVGTRQGHALICVHWWTVAFYIDNEYRVPYGELKYRERYDEHSRLEWPE